ncbi:DsbA family protein [Fulvimarina sp. 2208YS6-2-32]|uniref:DsbA family protein n=1 Tax=Fulvimarina uroteuthidis TaxID=3098149 RepID=A0ABU5I3P4_9HYPH|nr:DsbA family protein [Fulvimarina sp. 2208YS6-2-32]
MTRSFSASLKMGALALAGASLLTLAACSDEDSSANAIVQPDAGQSEASPAAGSAATDTAATNAATPAASSDAAPGEDAQQSTLVPADEAPEPAGSVDVAALMAEQALPDIVQGDPDAPVTIVEYASMTCGHCADFHENSYPAIRKAYLDTGKAKLILREFPFDPVSLAAFMLARCAGEDAQRTAMIDVLFDQQRSWASAESPSEALLKIARMAGMGQDEFVACLNNKELQQQIVDVQKTGQDEFGVQATPTFFINGQKYSGSMTPQNMAAAIEAATPAN